MTRRPASILAALLGLALTAPGCPIEEAPPIPEGPRVAVTVDPATIAGALDEQPIGFAFDTAQFTAGLWWWPGHDERRIVELPDLESEVLRNVTSALGPSTMRIGGTDCDGVWFCPTDEGCELPASYQDAFLDDEREEGWFTPTDLARAAAFAEAVDADILMCHNVGPGPRDPDTGAWQPDDARALIQAARAVSHGERFRWWEPGNEINSAAFNFELSHGITPGSFADDLATFRALIDEEHPGAPIPAPGSYWSPLGEFQDFTPELMEQAAALDPDPVDIVSWHLYATQSTGCPAIVDAATLDNLFDEELIARHREFATIVREAADGRPVWNTESASAQCGGQHGVSDTMIDALWYADWLGIMAEEGTSKVIRHALVGADYALLDEETFRPRPTMVMLVQHRRTVRRARLATTADRAAIKAHGYCSAVDDGEVSVVLANPTGTALVSELRLAGTAVASARQWTVAPVGGVDASAATIEGEEPAADGTFPDPEGTAVVVADGIAYPEIAPYAVVFASLVPEDASAACQP